LIRKATAEDIPSLFSISYHSFETPWSLQSFQAEFLKSFSKIFMYLDNSVPVGYLVVWTLPEEEPSEGEIVSIAVEPGFRGKGIAAELINYVIRKYHTVINWTLEVDARNIAAINLYKKYKFTKKRVITDYYGKGHDALLMAAKTINI
jgi:ribosomal-protein-alanine acetyltransferase